MYQAYIVFAILLITLALFIWGYWRYDVVAFFALIIALLTGVVPFKLAFSGFSHPAVVTVACIMIMSQAVKDSHVVTYLIKKISLVTKHTVWHVASLSFLTAALSAFMNNVGALALTMPIAIRTAMQGRRSPSVVLMPIAFASLLGGLITAIGTPPNIIITEFRMQALGQAYNMFDFTPVGLVLAIVGVLFISLVGWRLIPTERKAAKRPEDLFQIQDYITEIRVPEGSPIIDKTIRELEKKTEGDFSVLGLIRGKRRQLSALPNRRLKVNDVLIVEAAHDDLHKLLQAWHLQLETGAEVSSDLLRSEGVGLMEAVVPQGSRMEGRSAMSARLRSRYSINLLAIARKGTPYKGRLNQIKLDAGDVVLLQGDAGSLKEKAASLGFLPLVERGVQVGKHAPRLLPIVIFTCAILLATLRILPIQIAFASAVLAMVMSKVLPIRRVYKHIDWSIIVLLGSLIPIGAALETTGGSRMIAHMFVTSLGHTAPIFVLGALLIVTMLLTDIINNAATAVIMAPIALTIAQSLHVNIDPFLMTVAVGASSSFLTPIGHQNNTLVMGPGGYRFFDYLRLGLPLDLLIIVVGIPTILWVWPLS